jgi:hypothetical protein
MNTRFYQIMHSLAHSPQEWPKPLLHCEAFTMVAIGHSIIRVSNALVEGVGLQIATDITIRGMQS